MISICIPVYNVYISTLTDKLVNQCRSNNLDFEILIYDDGSTTIFKQENKKVLHYKEVIYKELEKNRGSAGIRNLMASEARFSNLLFIDSDSEFDKEYIKKYIPFFNQGYSIVCGGRIHPIELPDPSKSLRWKVGKVKEDFPAELRRKVPNKSFMSNNFLIQKEIFSIVAFDESISKSGHEDTMFGINLEINNIQIQHIDNPVIHIGLENNDEFICKTRQRLDTLFYLEQINNRNPLIYKRIKILNTIKNVRKAHLIRLFTFIYKKYNNQMERKLHKPNPNLVLYDIYKLSYYASLCNYL